MRMRSVGKAVAIALSAVLLAGCGGAADSADVSDDTEEAAYEATDDDEATDDEVEEGSYLSVVEDGVLKLPGLTFTLPDELAEELPNVAGTAVVDSQFEEAYIYLYDPSEDVMVQGMEPAFLWIMGIPVDDSLENFLPKIIRDTTDESVTVDMLKESFIEVGANSSFRYYSFDGPQLMALLKNEEVDREEKLLQEGIDQERISQALELAEAREVLLPGLEATELKLAQGQTADDISATELAGLTLQDMNGNNIKLGDIFAQNKLTMLEMWTTTCGSCVQSMPILEELSKEYASQGFGVMGVCCDVVDSSGEPDEDQLYDAQDIIKTTGVTYINVLANDAFRDLVEVTATPTIIYVDSKGNVVYGPQHGSYGKKSTAGIIEENLAKVQ